MRRRPLARTALAFALAMVPPSAVARSPRLAVAPNGALPAVAEGVTRLSGGSVLYRAPGAEPRPAPLLILFHGAGMSARQMLDGMIPEANRCGCLLLAVQSHGRTWDLVTAMVEASRTQASSRMDALFGADADRVEQALSMLLPSTEVDRSRIFMVGFSDGASYALSLGIANPALVRGVVAVAPGFHLEPSAIDPSQRLFIAHSPDDRILSFEASRDRIHAPLERAGFAAVFHPYSGGHRIDLSAVAIGTDYVLGRQSSLPDRPFARSGDKR